MSERSLLKSSRGNAAIEFAIVCPLFIVMLLGIMAYGGYFWMAHNVQELANDSARAAVGGLTAEEREQLAQAELAKEITDYGALNPAAATVDYSGDDQTYTVSVSYDASKSGSVFWSFTGLVPMPSSTIVRSATIKLGGY